MRIAHSRYKFRSSTLLYLSHVLFWCVVGCTVGVSGCMAARSGTYSSRGANARTGLGQRPNITFLVIAPQPDSGGPQLAPSAARYVLPDAELSRLLQSEGLTGTAAAFSPRLTLTFLKEFNIVIYAGMARYFVESPSAADAALARREQDLLLSYVKDGGGLLVIQGPGWSFDRRFDAMNAWLARTGLRWVPRQVADPKNAVTPRGSYKLFWTNNIRASKVTEGVRGILYPAAVGAFRGTTAFTPTIVVNSAWRVLIAAMPSARVMPTLRTSEANAPVDSVPLLATRAWGKGRIGVYTPASSTIWQDAYHFRWGRGATMRPIARGRPADGARLLTNLMMWLATPSGGKFGGFKARRMSVHPALKRAPDWSAQTEPLKRPAAWRQYVGLIGAQSNLSVGDAAPAAYIRAAREAGYDFLAFSEDLERLTAAKLKELDLACAAASSKVFHAYPGFRYRDDSGNTWLIFGPRLAWPSKRMWSTTHPGRLASNNAVSRGYGWAPLVWMHGLSSTEPPWLQGNFKVFSVYSYRNGWLVDDSFRRYLRLLSDGFGLRPVAVHLVTTPRMVLAAKRHGYQTVLRWFQGSDPIRALTGDIIAGHAHDNIPDGFTSYVTAGPRIDDIRWTNARNASLALGPAAQRFRVGFRASSPAGLRELTVLNASSGVALRHYVLSSQRRCQLSEDLYHDRQRQLVAVVTDSAGNRAISELVATRVSENWFGRASDNWNTMWRGDWWGAPAAAQPLVAFEDYSVSRDIYYQLPVFAGASDLERPAVEFFPQAVSQFGTAVSARLMWHYPRSAYPNPNLSDMPELATPNTDITGRVEHKLFTPWQDGPMALLVRGHLKLQRPLGRRAVRVTGPIAAPGAEYLGLGGSGARRKPRVLAGSASFEVRAGDYAALYPSPAHGSVAIVPLSQPMIVKVQSTAGKANVSAWLRTGPKAREVDYDLAVVIGPLGAGGGTQFADNITREMGVDGAWPVQLTVRRGTARPRPLVLDLRANAGSFEAIIGQAKLPFELPADIRGLNPHWDAAIWYKGKQTFIVPVNTENDNGVRYTSRIMVQIRDRLVRLPITSDGSGMVQIDTAVGTKDVFIGNLVQADDPDLRVLLFRNGQGAPYVVAHNPTNRTARCTIWAAPGFTLYGRFKRTLSIPAGSSVRFSTIDPKSPVERIGPRCAATAE